MGGPFWGWMGGGLGALLLFWVEMPRRWGEEYKSSGKGPWGCFLVTGPRVGEMGGSPSLSTGRFPERMREPQRSPTPLGQLLWP